MGSKQRNSANDKTNRLGVLERLTPDESGAALAICCGIAMGLYKAKDISSDGALGWASDFPAEEAGHAVAELIRACPVKDRNPVRDRLLADLSKYVPAWIDYLGREADRNVAIVMSQVEGRKTGARP